MNLKQALRLFDTPCLAFTGAGGKTTALFQLARELPPPVIVTTTTHLHIDQIKLADSHWIVEEPDDFLELKPNQGEVILITGLISGYRTLGVKKGVLNWLREKSINRSLPLLIEADGSRQKPLKAPSEHEPPIPEFVDTVIVVAGMLGLNEPLSSENVHRPEIFARLGALHQGEMVTMEALTRVLIHPSGGLKNIPPQAKRVALLNQADTPDMQAQSKLLAEKLLHNYCSVIITSLQQNIIHAVYEPIAGIILAAGASSRFGQPKQMLVWRGQPFIRTVAQTALTAGLSPVIVVTGAESETIVNAIIDLPLTIAYNPDWKSGQSSSIRVGLRTLSKENGAAIFLLADQPQVTPPVLRALIEQHATNLSPIVAPLIDDRRVNPVLFDCTTFSDLLSLTGDMGGRGIFNKHPISYLSWYDTSLLIDVDTPEDYTKLVTRGNQ